MGAVAAFAVCTQDSRRLHSHRLVTEYPRDWQYSVEGKNSRESVKVSRSFGISDLARSSKQRRRVAQLVRALPARRHRRSDLDRFVATRPSAIGSPPGTGRWCQRVAAFRRPHRPRATAPYRAIPVVLGDHLDAVFQDGHHPAPEKIDLVHAKVGGTLFVPLSDGATLPWRRGSRGTTLLSIPWQMAKPPDCRPQMLRRVWNSHCESCSDRIRRRGVRQRVGFTTPLPWLAISDSLEGNFVEAERFARFVDRRFVPVGDDVSQPPQRW